MIENKFVEKDLLNTINSKDNYTELYVLYGVLNRTVINHSIGIIESKLKELIFSNSLISRVKLITVELLDNIMKHQTQIDNHLPYFKVGIIEKGIVFSSGNSISNKDAKQLNNKLKHLKSEDANSIKKLYIEKLKTGKLDDKGNAGLGILSILKRPGQKFHYELEPINNNGFYFNNSIILLN